MFAKKRFEIERLALLEREVFGPILHVIRYRASRLDQVIEAINATGYGLTLGIHSRIDETVQRIAALDRVNLEVAIPLMQYSRVREPSIAAQNLWDAVKASQTEAISQAKSAKQALEDNQANYQKALDDAWAAAPK